MIFEFGVIFLQDKTTERANVILRLLREIKHSEGFQSTKNKNQNTKYGSSFSTYANVSEKLAFHTP